MSSTRSASTDDNLPTARVTANHGPVVMVACPICTSTHVHIWRLGDDLAPVRPAHCAPHRLYRLAARELPAA